MADFISAAYRLVVDGLGRSRGFTDTTFQIVLEKLPFERREGGFERSRGVKCVALFALRSDERLDRVLDLFTQR